MRRGMGLRLAGLVVVLAAAVAFTACGVTNVAAPKKPPTATEILAAVSKTDVKDMTYTMTMNATTDGKAFTGSGTGKFTKSPSRSDLAFTFTMDGQTITMETITDGTTSYTKMSGMDLPGLPSDKWMKGSGSLNPASFLDQSQLTDYSKLKGVTLVGPDTIGGVAVWHLKGSESDGGSDTTANIYVRQDNNLPQKVVIHGTGTFSGDVTITFTAINTGITITPPSDDQVVSLGA